MFTPNPFRYAIAAPPHVRHAIHHGLNGPGASDVDIRQFAPIITSTVQDEMLRAAAGMNSGVDPSPLAPLYSIETDPFPG